MILAEATPFTSDARMMIYQAPNFLVLHLHLGGHGKSLWLTGRFPKENGGCPLSKWMVYMDLLYMVDFMENSMKNGC